MKDPHGAQEERSVAIDMREEQRELHGGGGGGETIDMWCPKVEGVIYSFLLLSC